MKCQHVWQLEMSCSITHPEGDYPYVACTTCGEELEIKDVSTALNDLQARAEKAEAEAARLRTAIESVKTQAQATPICAEDETKGASVYNWLMYVYRLLESAIKEDEA